jgi:hypothetical protein
MWRILADDLKERAFTFVVSVGFGLRVRVRNVLYL